MLSEALVSVRDGHTDRVLLDKNYPRDVGQVILRSLLMGRKEFSVPAETSTATSALDAYLKWFPSILSRIKEGCRNAALGTRFEEQVLNSTMKMLELHPRLGEKELFGEFNLS